MDNRLPSLAGHRVVLREPRAADAERLFAYTSDPEVTRFLAFDPPRSVAESLRFIARAEVLRACDAEYVFTIADSLTGEPLGITGLRHLDLMMGTAQIGTWLRRASWGTGVNPEAKRLLLAYAFGRLGLHRIEARIAVENRRSRDAFVKLGGRFEGTLRESFRKNGVLLDQGLYAILAPEWRAVPGHTAAPGTRNAEGPHRG
jgi:[ribosomal protein S5]-alanine N-acetyltransferase